MQTGNDVLTRAMQLLHYTDSSGQVDTQQYAALYGIGLPVVDQIYCDLWHLERTGEFVNLTALTQSLDLPVRLINDVMPYGVAMLLAQNNGDGDNQLLFATLYNQKRSLATQMFCREDVLP